jgi:hypothetical protein
VKYNKFISHIQYIIGEIIENNCHFKPPNIINIDMADPQIPINFVNPTVSVNRSQAEQAVYVQIDGDSRFPAISSVVVLDNAWPDNTQAFIPSDKKLGSSPLSGSFWTPQNPPPSLTAVTVFPKFATLNYVVNSEDFILGQGGFTSLTTAQTAYGTFGGIQIVTATVFDGLTATGSTVGALTGVAINPTILYGPFTGVAVRTGIVMALNA